MRSVSLRVVFIRHGATAQICERQAAYRALLGTEQSGLELDRIRTTVNQGWPLGSDRFRGEIEAALKRAANPPKRGRPTQSSIDETADVKPN